MPLVGAGGKVFPPASRRDSMGVGPLARSHRGSMLFIDLLCVRPASNRVVLRSGRVIYN